jgi:hypothetical protein
MPGGEELAHGALGGFAVVRDLAFRRQIQPFDHPGVQALRRAAIWRSSS